MILKATVTANDYSTKTLDAKREQLKDLTARSTEIKAGILKADQDMKTATEAGNAESYKKAKADLDDLNIELEMIESRVQKLEAGQLLPAEDYKNLTGAILEEYDREYKRTLKTLAELLKDMIREADELNEAKTTADQALKTLQHDLNKDADRKQNPDGSYREYWQYDPDRMITENRADPDKRSALVQIMERIINSSSIIGNAAGIDLNWSRYVPFSEAVQKIKGE